MCELISRRAAIEAVINGMPDCPNGYSDTYDKRHIIAVLEDVPSVQPEETIEEVARDIATIIENEKDMRVILNALSVQPQRMRGKWVQQTNPQKECYGYYECNICGTASYERGNYCAFCGADMREGEDDR